MPPKRNRTAAATATDAVGEPDAKKFKSPGVQPPGSIVSAMEHLLSKEQKKALPPMQVEMRIKEVEERLGARLPSSLKELFKTYNGCALFS